VSGSSYRTLLRASSITGAAQLIGLAASLVKMKAVAVLLGSAGVGLMGLYMNLVATAASIAGLGVGSVGKRQIATAQAEGGEVALGRTRRALFWGTLLLALLGALVFALGRAPIARLILDDETRAPEVAWLSLGVALTVAASSQGALLTGMRRVGDLARIKVSSGVVGVLLGVAILAFWREQGLVAMFLMTP
jgi:O-antigen/teichoic acid export membrane protein